MRLKLAISVLAALVTIVPASSALERPGVEFKVFQFPANMIPRIDGQTGDWAMVPASYAIGMDQLSDTDKGRGTNIDRSDMDVTVKVGPRRTCTDRHR